MRKELLKVTNLKKHFPIKGGIFGRTINHVKAVDGVTFSIYEGETVSIVGESGCGKSTAGRAILRLDEPTDGKVLYDGEDLLAHGKRKMREIRKDIQVIFQDPFASLNPRQTVRQLLSEAMIIQKLVPKEAMDAKVIELLETVGLNKEQADRYPHEFSGGQRQRIGIARALSVNPELIICDEAVSALDVSIQAQVINLLKNLQKELHLTYLFISHDLGVVRHISDRVIVMYLGKFVEIADKKSLFTNPQHPYTKALLSAIPTIHTDQKKERILLSGDVPSPIDPPTGCRFHTRCPFATEICVHETPTLRQTEEMEEGHVAACHHMEEIAAGTHSPEQL